MFRPHALFLCTTLAVALPAFAGDRIAVVAPGLDAEGQLEEVLCVSQTCVPASKVLTGGHVDQKKLQKEGVTLVVSGKKVPAGVTIQVADANGAVRYTSTVKAGAGAKLAVGTLVTVAAETIAAIENPAPKAQPAKKTAVAKASTRTKYVKKLAAARSNRRG